MLEGYSGFQTNSADVVRTALFSDLGANYFDMREQTGRVALNVHWSKQKDLTIVSSYCNTRTDVKYVPATFVRQYFEIGPIGRFRFSIEGQTSELSFASPSVIVPADTPFRLEALADHDLLVLRIEADSLRKKLQALLGEEVPGDVRFERPHGARDQRHKSMKQAVIQYASCLDLYGPNMPPLVYEELGQALMIQFLLCNSHNFSARLSLPPVAPSFNQLQRAEDYLETHWDQPFDIAALAKASNVSARSVFRYFKAARGITPAEFLKTVRLERARMFLSTADQHGAIMTIGMKCGFHSLGHFSREYRNAFGELPSETLRKSKRG